MISNEQQTLTLDDALQQAVVHHKEGRLTEAEQIYRAILELQSDHPDANHNLGVIAGQVGQPAAGLPYLQKALAINPNNGQFVLSYAEALLVTGQANDALNLLETAMQRGFNTFAAQALRQQAEEVVRTNLALVRSGGLSSTELPQAVCNQLVDLFNAGHYEELESRTRLLVEQYPDSGFVWKVFGASLQGQGKYALPALQKAIALLPNDAAVHNNLGLALKALGQLDDAMASYHRALEINTEYADVHSNLGVVFARLGQLEDAVASYRRALEINPEYAEVYYNLGIVFGRHGKLDDEVASYRRALAIKPGYAEAHYNLALALVSLGRLNDAEASYRRVLEINPHDAEACVCLGNVLKNLGHFEDAVTSYRRALEINPNLIEALCNMGVVLGKLGQVDGEAECYRQALEIDPDFAEGYYNLGVALVGLGRFVEAVACYRRVLEINPESVQAHNNLGNILKELGRIDEAIASYRRALEIRPDCVEAHSNLGNVLNALGQFDDAVVSYRRALEINPDSAETLCNMGVALKQHGQLDEALECFRRALEIRPDFVDVRSNLIFGLDLSAGMEFATLQQERRRWDAIHAEPLAAIGRPHINRPEPERRLRIGYVSADFRRHSAAVGFGAMLTRFAPAEFEVYAYYNSMIEDESTHLFQKSVTTFRKIAGLSDDYVADLIRKDGIDILVDLSGFSSGNRLLVFARKPAPIQITAWGYAGGTGMKAMDVLFSDPVIVPPEEKAIYTEEVRYLPSVISAFFPTPFPPVNTMPAKGITFGSLNRLDKLSAETYLAWSRILLTVPESRMIIKSYALSDAGTRERVASRFIEAGIDPERLTLLGYTNWQDHVLTFNRIDISLDSFPQSGGVTTLEALKMGVPVVTLRGDTFVGRGSTSILTTLGLTDWIAETPEQYVDIAIQKARALPLLSTGSREQLRELFSTSIIGDTQAYVRTVEREYRTLWREWCTRQVTVN